jgi:hypothetical protein
VVQDSQKELQDLTSVHAFYLGLLEKSLGHAVLVPAELMVEAKKPVSPPAVPETEPDAAPAAASESQTPSEVKTEAKPDTATTETTEVPPKAESKPEGGSDSGDKTAATIQAYKNWLNLLDLATTPPQVRDALKTIPGFDTAHSLLRYFASKASVRAGDRDKTDCIITHMFRHPVGDPPAWHRPEVDSSYVYISQAALAFEAQLYRALGDVHYDSMSPEHVQLVREFEYFYQELEEFRHFDKIMDSGIVQRVRELKQSLGKSFYHPDALANVAAWNDVFGRKFDILFHEATKQIKTFAEHVQKEGGSILSRIEGDITVKNLSEIETSQLLAEDYQYAQDEFRKVSRYQKAVDGKGPNRPVAAPQREDPPPAPPVARPPIPAPDTLQPLAAPVAAPDAPAAPAAVAPVRPPAPPARPAAPPRPPAISNIPLKAEVLAVPPSQAVNNAVQEGKIHSAREQIKEHVRSSASNVAHVVPVKKTRLTLSPAEVEAFRVDYDGEKSFRASYATIMMTAVAYLSRMIIEVDEYNQKAGSAYLWKPHADALGYLLTTLDRLNMEAAQLMAVARTRGLADKAAALQASLDKVKDYAKTVSQTLQATDQSAENSN